MSIIMNIKRLITIGTAAALGTALVAAVPAVAAPSSGTATVNWPARSYTSPADGSQPIRAFNAGYQAQAICSVKGTHTNGTDVWIRLAQVDGGGYISRSAVSVPSLALC
jgi:hypothetical protein